MEVFKNNLSFHRYELAVEQINAILTVDSEKAKLICQSVLQYSCSQLALTILQHKIFPYYLPTEQLQKLAQMNQLCAESFAQNPALLEKTGYHFIQILLQQYHSIYAEIKKYWDRYDHNTLMQLTKDHSKLLSDYLIWVLNQNDSTQNFHMRTHVTQVLFHANPREVALSLDECPQILSPALLTLPSHLMQDWQRELCVWIAEYHLEKLNLSALLHLFELYPQSSQKALSDPCCIKTLAHKKNLSEQENFLNHVIQDSTVFSKEPLVSLNLLGSALRRYLNSSVIKKIVTAFCGALRNPDNPKIDSLFLLNVAVFVEQLFNKKIS